MGDDREPDEPREEALRAAVHDLAKAVRLGDATLEEVRLRQVRIAATA